MVPLSFFLFSRYLVPYPAFLFISLLSLDISPLSLCHLQLPLHAVGSQVKSWTLSILTYVWHNDAEAFSALLCQKNEARKMKRLKMKIRRLFSPSILPFVCDPTGNCVKGLVTGRVYLALAVFLIAPGLCRGPYYDFYCFIP